MAVISILIIAVTLLACDFARRTIRHYFEPSLSRSLVLDFVITIELCTGSFELGVILENYGVWVWSVGLYLLAFYQCSRWQGFTMPTPLLHFLDSITGHATWKEAAMRTLVLLASGWMTYQYISAVWRLELSTFHSQRPEKVAACSIPWKELETYKCFLAEVIGSFVLGIGPQLVSDNPTLSNNDPVVTAGINAALVTVTVVAVLDISGGMFNPMLASILLGGCTGHSWIQHILVYWIGAALGTLAAFKVYPTIKEMVYPVHFQIGEETKKDL
ncbi:hypothetical protein TCAL_08896 [Tigriopus californicus]|uniref:Aquaporin n=1 Tax=Tigriopus californicus TaxID=6832 RepID=A0A553NVV5_TIGCA|nr:aquaporin-11-like [Tigriopus californicus]TRY69563.1 hypothetical protein TCAL_08896 [Tigriopus californicus]|eukprot:TCALIF_08896-PA protein Name:"Similar to Aqp11 Aquaporin-11 (Rattus norvegicus)" AED:0.03 eAED:0.03 QI:0/-1/0/1/-1/1/1/0/272